jgi:hypothetical protein
MGWRTTTTRLPAAFRVSTTARVVWLLPEPVRTAQMATTGTVASSIVSSGPRRTNDAPAAMAVAA